MSHLLSSVFHDLDPRFDIIESICNKILYKTEIDIINFKSRLETESPLIKFNSQIVSYDNVEKNCYNKYKMNEHFKSLDEMITAVNKAKKLVNSLKS